MKKLKLFAIVLIIALLGTMFLPFLSIQNVNAQANPNPTVLFTHPFKQVTRAPIFQGYENKTRKYHFLGGDLVFVRVENAKGTGQHLNLLLKETGEILQNNYPYNYREVYNWKNSTLLGKTVSLSWSYIPTTKKNNEEYNVYTNIANDYSSAPEEDFRVIKVTSDIEKPSTNPLLAGMWVTEFENFEGNTSFVELELYNYITGKKHFYRLGFNKKIVKVLPIGDLPTFILSIEDWTTLKHYRLRVDGGKVQVQEEMNLRHIPNSFIKSNLRFINVQKDNYGGDTISLYYNQSKLKYYLVSEKVFKELPPIPQPSSYIAWFNYNKGKPFVFIFNNNGLQINPRIHYIEDNGLEDHYKFLDAKTNYYYRQCDGYIEARKKEYNSSNAEVFTDMGNCSWPLLEAGNKKAWYVNAYKVVRSAGEKDYFGDYIFHYINGKNVVVFTTRGIMNLSTSQVLLPSNVAEEKFLSSVESFEKDYFEKYEPKIKAIHMDDKLSLDKTIYDILNLKEYFKLRTTQFNMNYANALTELFLEYYKKAYYEKLGLNIEEIDYKWDSNFEKVENYLKDMNTILSNSEELREEFETISAELQTSYDKIKGKEVNLDFIAKVNKNIEKYWDFKQTNHHTVNYSPKEYHKIDASTIIDNPDDSYFPFGKWNELKRKEPQITAYFNKEKEIADKNHIRELYDNAKNYFATRLFLSQNETALKTLNYNVPTNKTNELNDPTNTNPVILNQLGGDVLFSFFNLKLKDIDNLIYDTTVKKPFQAEINGATVNMEKIGEKKLEHFNLIPLFNKKTMQNAWYEDYLPTLTKEKEKLQRLFPKLKDDYSNHQEYFPITFIPIYMWSMWSFPADATNPNSVLFNYAGVLNTITSAIDNSYNFYSKILEKVEIDINVAWTTKKYKDYIKEINDKQVPDGNGGNRKLNEIEKLTELLKATPSEQSVFTTVIMDQLRLRKEFLNKNLNFEPYNELDKAFEKELKALKDELMNETKEYDIKNIVMVNDPADPTGTTQIPQEQIVKKKINSLFSPNEWNNTSSTVPAEFVKYKQNLWRVRDWLNTKINHATTPLTDKEHKWFDRIDFIAMYYDYQSYINTQVNLYKDQVEALEKANSNGIKYLKYENTTLCVEGQNIPNCIINIEEEGNYDKAFFIDYLKFLLPQTVKTDIQTFIDITTYFGNRVAYNTIWNNYKDKLLEVIMIGKQMLKYVDQTYGEIEWTPVIPDNYASLNITEIKKIVDALSDFKLKILSKNNQKRQDEILEVKNTITHKARLDNIKNYDFYTWNTILLDKNTINDFIEEKRVYDELISPINEINLNNIDSFTDYYVPKSKFFNEYYMNLLKNVEAKKLLYKTVNLLNEMEPNGLLYELIDKSVSLAELDKNINTVKMKGQEILQDAYLEFAKKMWMDDVDFKDYIEKNFNVAVDPKNEEYNFNLNPYIRVLTNTYNIIMADKKITENNNHVLKKFNRDIDEIVKNRTPLLNSWYNDLLLSSLRAKIAGLEDKYRDLLRNAGKELDISWANKDAIPFNISIERFLGKDGKTVLYQALPSQISENYKLTSFDIMVKDLVTEINKFRLNPVSSTDPDNNRYAVTDPAAEKAKRRAFLDELTDLYDKIEIIVENNTKKFIEQYFNNLYVSLNGVNNIGKLENMKKTMLEQLNLASKNITPNQYLCIDLICGDVDDSFITTFTTRFDTKYKEILGKLLTEKYDKYVRPLITIYGKNDVVDFTDGSVRNITENPESVLGGWSTPPPTPTPVNNIGEYQLKGAKFMFYKNVLIGISSNWPIDQLENPEPEDTNLRFVFTDANANRTNYTVVNDYSEAPLQRTIFIRIPGNKEFRFLNTTPDTPISPTAEHRYVFAILIPNGSTNLTLEDKRWQKLMSLDFPAVYNHDEKELIKTQIEIELMKMKDMAMPTEKMFNDMLYTRLMTLSPFDTFKKIQDLEEPLRTTKNNELLDIINEKISGYGFLTDTNKDKYATDMQELLTLNDMIIFMNIHNYDNIKATVETRLLNIIYQDAKDYLTAQLNQRYESINNLVNNLNVSTKTNTFDKMLKDFNLYLTDTVYTNIEKKKQEIDEFITLNFTDLEQAQRLRELLLQEFERVRQIIERNIELAKYSITGNEDNQDVQILNLLTEAFGTQNIRQIKESVIFKKLLTIVDNAYTIDTAIFTDLTNSTKAETNSSKINLETKEYNKIDFWNVLNMQFDNVVKMKSLNNIDVENGRNDMAKFNILVLKNGNYNIPINIKALPNNIDEDAFIEKNKTPIAYDNTESNGSTIQGIQYRSMEIPIVDKTTDTIVGKKDDLGNNKVFLLGKHLILENMPAELMVMKNYNNLKGDLVLHNIKLRADNTLESKTPVYLGDMLIDNTSEKHKILENDVDGLKVKRMEIVTGNTDIPAHLDHHP